VLMNAGVWGVFRVYCAVGAFLLFSSSSVDSAIVELLPGIDTLGESEHASEAFYIQASRTDSIGEDLTVVVRLSYADGSSSGGIAEYGTDYDPAPYRVTVVIPMDSTVVTVPVSLTSVDDTDDEEDERIIVYLEPDDTYERGASTGITVVIRDDDDRIPPSIITHPGNRTVMQGETVRFSVTVSGSVPIRYRWRKNGSEVYSADVNEYTTPPVTIRDSGALYDCIVENVIGSDTSSQAVLTVTRKPVTPHIITQPKSTAVSKGETARFAVEAGGSKPLGYQWYADSGRLVGETLDTLALPDRRIEHSGREYYCVVSNTAGAVQSLGVRLTVRPPTSQMLVVTGELLRSGGTPGAQIDSQVVDMVVRLYPEPTGGTPVYTEHFRAENNRGVVVTRGTFGIHLGTGVTSDDLGRAVRENPALYVSFTVAEPGETGAVLEPRTPLTASPYALSAGSPTIRGALNPEEAGIDATIGTWFIDTRSGETWVKTFNSWVLEE